MLKKQLAILLVASAFTSFIFALTSEHHTGNAAIAENYIKEIEEEDNEYVAAKGSAYFQKLSQGQMPRATVVTCSDSRVHTNILDKTPEGDLFVISNIGNQMATSLGSVEYGINHLGSSLLLIVGHSKCGAISAASSDYSNLEPAIIKELNTISIAKGSISIDGVKANVNNQVSVALKEFADKVNNHELLVVGAVYDFANDMKLGAGKLNIINVNGDTDPVKLQKMAERIAQSGFRHYY